MNGIPSPTLRRVAAAVSARRWAIASVCLLIAAVALRFYDLSAASLWHDEAIAAINSRGALSDVVANAATRYANTSPILYPLALWAVQKVASAEFSVRLLPAAASALTVGALLFWMPRLGVPRRAAFLSALLAALSVAAIEHAQDAREYSVDALLAVLLIVGLLQYLRDGRKALLCAALFVAPLLQYGLALFCVAVIGVAVIAPSMASQTGVCGARGLCVGALWRRLTQRFGLLLPIACFAAGCAATWALTGRHQWGGGGWGSSAYLADFYYQGGYDAAAIAEFAFSRTWSLLSYHMPPIIAAAALFVFGALLLATALKRRRVDAVALLCALALGVSLCAAIAGLYPFGGSRHNLYLGPLIFLAAGVAFHTLADDMAALMRRAWVAPALAAGIAAAIALAGAAAIRQADTYYTDTSMKQVLAALDGRIREGDAVYVSRWEVPAVEFYKGGKPANYFYGKAVCWGPYAEWAACVPEMLDEMFISLNNARRIWLIHNASVSAREEVAAYSQDAQVEAVAPDGRAALRDRRVDVWTSPHATLHLITGYEKLAANIRNEWLYIYDDLASTTPIAASAYNLYLQYDALYYAKRPCAAADKDARFFLHIYPTDAVDLPEGRRQVGFDNLDFDFHDYGLAVDDRCIIKRALPNYPIERISAGQFIAPNGPRVWETEFSVKP